MSIIISIPFFTSLIVLYFYFLIRPKDKMLRFIPYILISIISETIYLAYLHTYTYTTNIIHERITSPPFTLLAMLFLLLFLYEVIKRKTIFWYYLTLYLLPIIFLFFGFISGRLGFTFWEENKFYYWLRFFGGVIFALIYVIILAYQIHTRKVDKYKIERFAWILLVQLGLMAVLLSVSVGVTLYYNIFFKMIFFVFKIIETIIIVQLYFHLFKIYKTKLEIEGEEKFNSFDSLSKLMALINETKNELDNTDRTFKDEEKLLKTGVKRYEKSLVKPDKLTEYKRSVLHFFDTEQEKYLDVDFNMQKLSAYTGISSYYLSQTFNIGLNQNFNQYLSLKRIDYACKLLHEHGKNIPVSELCHSCGYKSRTSFYGQFKNVTKISLAEYRNNV